MNTTMQRINILRGQCGIDDDTWREEVLPRFGGKPDGSGRVSLKSVSLDKQKELLAELEAKAPKQTADWREPRIVKIKTMWGLLHKEGIAHKADDKAMRAWCDKAAGVKTLEKAPAKKLDGCIEAMKKWAQREGFGVRYVGEHRHTELYKLG